MDGVHQTVILFAYRNGENGKSGRRGIEREEEDIDYILQHTPCASPRCSIARVCIFIDFCVCVCVCSSVEKSGKWE
jgi:hypothetical protein